MNKTIRRHLRPKNKNNILKEFLMSVKAMAGIIPSYKKRWEFLSEKHRELEDKLESILKEYSESPSPNWPYWSNAVIGVFGAGKTQFLYHIYQKSLQYGFLPLYFLAEDLFGDIFKVDEDERTPGKLSEIASKKVETAKNAIAKNDREALEKILNPKNREELREMIQDLLNVFSSKNVSNAKTVVLVDELEQQYKSLQDKVRADERSPLRDWLERKDFLKFVALAPAGIYEMGKADQTRCHRLVIPPVDVEYIKKKYFRQHPGKANACWWLSRGKPRHVFKAFEKLRDLNTTALEPGEIKLFIRDELDPIGEEPSSVPPAILEGLPVTKWRYVLDLSPIETEPKRRYCVNADRLNFALLAEKLSEFFKIRREEAVLVSYYLKTIIKALSDQHNLIYLDPNDLAELFALTIDLLLEYEHASPGTKERLGEFMRLYEDSKDPSLHAYLLHFWEMKETVKGLPLTIKEIRATFPFPIMNPIVKGHLPKAVKEKWEGKGLPLWKWEKNNTTILFFASWRDFENYVQTDEFRDLALPQGKGVLYILPAGELKEKKSPLIEWLERNGKVRGLVTPSLLTDFLLSLAGEIEGEIPGRFSEIISILQESKENEILSRKVRIYYESINRLVSNSLPEPSPLWIESPPYADTVWGKNQIGDRKIVIPCIALAFADLSLKERQLVALLHELFKGGRKGAGVGDLHFSLPRGGYVSMATDILTRYESGDLKESEPISKLKRYFKKHKELVSLARLVSLNDFLKLENEENINRLLESFWRAVRGEFDYKGLDYLANWLEKDVLPTIDAAVNIEARAVNILGLEGIDFEESEDIVRAKDSLQRLLQGIKEALTDEGEGAPLVKALFTLFVRPLKDKESTLSDLQGQLEEARQALDNLEKVCENLRKNLWEYRKASQFAEIKEEHIEEAISEVTSLRGRITLRQLTEKADDGRQRLESLSSLLEELEKQIDLLSQNFNELTRG
ncbi:MAG: hypothetical protein B6U95_07050 [Thermofilum sp. ex4484_82]|nr:MAG: hypothetical protein B6U95_07050 [Thermofilum sp. ex4484_82]